MKTIALFLITILSTSCISQEKKMSNKNKSIQEKTKSQIAQYVVSCYEDSKGNLWFGTLSKGIAKYDGKVLRYISKKDGLPSDRVTGVIEDNDGNLWFKTGEGLTKFDGKKYVNFRVKDDFATNSITSVIIDSNGTFWVGTWGGVFTFNGKEFKHFPVPYPKVKTTINKDTKDWITALNEDSKGNIWIGRDGHGACKYDGKNFYHYLKKDGLHSNNVTSIEFDKDENVWFGTRVAEKDNPDPKMRFGKGGVNKLTENGIISFPEIESFNENDVYEIHADNSGFLWISTVKNGVYRYDGQEFKHFDVPISITSFLKDRNDNFWLGGAGGLYRINKNGDIVNVTTIGPWK